MPVPTISTRVLQDDGRWLVTLSDGSTFYAPHGAVPQAGLAVALTAPPANLTASADTALTFAQQVSTVNVQNNSGIAVWIAFDTAASNGSMVQVPAGMLFSQDIHCSVLHIWAASALAVNGSGGVAVWGTV